MKEIEWNKIGWFLTIGIISAVIYILLTEKLHEIIPSGTFLGQPFDYADFVLILIFLCGTVIGYIFFKNYKKNLDKKRRLS